MTQMFSFNLVDEPWIPCVRDDGSTTVLGLRDTFTQAHKLNAISAESPPVTAALHRLLLTILHRVFGPADYDDWASLWERERWDTDILNAYLDQWHYCFDLFDEERPFYQAPDERMKVKSTISLSHDRSSGNNPTLFDHHTEAGGETLSPAEAARALITGQAFALAGLSGITQKFTDGTCAAGIIFLVEGNNLKETFLLNMIQYPPDNDQFAVHTSEDKPSWEMEDPFTPDRSSPFGYLDYLTWQNRRVLLQPENSEGQVVVKSMTMGPALRYDTSLLDPMKHYRPDKKLGHVAISLKEDRIFWRDSASFFTFHKDIQDRARPPSTFKWLRELVAARILDRRHIYRDRAIGISKKQAKVFFYREEQLPMPLVYLKDDALVESLARALEFTDRVAFGLVLASRRTGMYFLLPDADGKKWMELNANTRNDINSWIAYTGMERRYWSSLDLPFQSFIVDLVEDEENALVNWSDQLRCSAHDAFDQAAEYVGFGPRSFKAIVRGQSALNYHLNESLPRLETSDDQEVSAVGTEENYV